MKRLITMLLCAPLAAYSQKCNQKLWAHVYKPDRLQVIEKCKTVTGVIYNAPVEKDGDVHIRLKLDAGQEGLLNDKNNSPQEHGCLVVEPICEYPVTQPDAKSACKDFKQVLKIPPNGTHVRVTGSYVLDKKHGWNEIHPVTKIEIIQ